ncbi:MAG TPA: nicotinate phosphoribosyltransferase, partial [Anaerolineae bacterium]|nr:nicotinate phosphoribosyltransferase [Anaerolineae bacterium]
MTQKIDYPIHLALSEDRADVYFARTQTILQKEGLDPVVTMEVFANGGGVLCGMKEVLDLLASVLPETAEVWALEEGETMSAREVVLRITAPYSSFGLYETALLGILAHQSGWATAAREVVEAAAGIPVISFGARHVHPNVSAQLEYAAVVGGCVGCATPAGARLAGLSPTGTIPHAMIL